MKFISLIIYIIFTLTITSSAPIEFCTSKQIRDMENNNMDDRKQLVKEDDVTAQPEILVNGDHLANGIESITGNARFQNDITQPYAYQTDSKHPIVKVVDTSIKAGKSSDRPLHWTLPDSRLWFATLLPHNSTSVNSEDLKMSQSITSQPTVKRRSTILSTLPLTSRLYDVLTELPTSYESALASRDVAFS